MKPPIKLCIVNRNYPPKSGATGFFAAQLVRALSRQAKEIKCCIVSTGSFSETQELKYVKSLYEGKNKFRRLLATYVESYRLLKRAKKLKADVYIVMTDPPFLNYWASKLLKEQTWISWTMDLYPEAFAANGLISKSSFLYRLYCKRIKKGPPSHLLCLGKHQYEYLEREHYQNVQSTVLPIGLRNLSLSNEKPSIGESTKDKNVITFAYVGSIGEAHDAEALVSFIKELNREAHAVKISCRGAKSSLVISELELCRYVEIIDFMTEEDMSTVDIQIVTLLNTWTHICVPSKALSALEYNSAIVFLGSGESDTWQYVSTAAWRITKDSDTLDLIRDLEIGLLEEKKAQAKVLRDQLKVTYKEAVVDLTEVITSLQKE